MRALSLLGAEGAAATLCLAAPATSGVLLALALAVAASALGYAAFLARRVGPLSLRRLWASTLAWPIVAGLGVPAAIGAVLSADEVLSGMARPGAWLPRIAGPAAVLAIVLLVASARAWPDKWSDLRFVALVGAPVTAAKIAYVHLVEMRPISDFASMWSLVSRIAASGFPVPGDAIEWILLERVVPYLLPLRLLFGPQPSTYSVPNVLVGVACSAATYALARRWFSRAAARLAFALSIAAPETWLAAEIPTHDIPGVAFAVFALVLLCLTYDRVLQARPAALGWGLGTGLLVLALDLQRSIGMLFLAGCASVLTVAALFDLHHRGELRRSRLALAATALLLLPASTLVAGRVTLAQAGLAIPGALLAPHRQSVLFAGTASWSDGLPWTVMEEAQRYRDLPLDTLWRARIATELALDPGALIGAYVRHSRTLFALGSQIGVYIGNASIGRGGRTVLAPEGTVLLVSGCFSVLFIAALLRGLWRIARSPLTDLSMLAPLAFLALLAGTLILLGQVQSRYLYPIWYLGALYAGSGLARATMPALTAHPRSQAPVLASPTRAEHPQAPP